MKHESSVPNAIMHEAIQHLAELWGIAVKYFEAARRKPSGVFEFLRPEGLRPTATIARFSGKKHLTALVGSA